MSNLTNGQVLYPAHQLADLPTPPSISQVLKEQEHDTYTFSVSCGGKSDMFFINRGNSGWYFGDLHEAMTFLAERSLEEDPTNASFEALEPISGLMKESDRSRVLEILQTFGKKLTEMNPVVFNSQAELIATLDKEFPRAKWLADKATIASDPLTREYLERKVAIQLANSNPTIVQQKARQLKNALYYQLRYGNAISIVPADRRAETVKMKHAKKRKAA